MALRFLARKVGIPALRGASGPRVSPSAGTSRPLTSSSYQGGRNYGAGAGAGGAKKPARGDSVHSVIAQMQARFEAKRAAIMKMRRDEKINRRIMIGSSLAGLGVALIITEPPKR